MWTDWWCKRCHAAGVIQSKHDASLMDVNEQLSRAHERTREAARERCAYSPLQVQVRLRTSSRLRRLISKRRER